MVGSSTKISVISTLDEAKQLSLSDVKGRSEPDKILMCDPSHFEIKDAKNPFMQGNVGKVDTDKARAQWEAVKGAFEKAGRPVEVLASRPGLEDMTFGANQVLPFVDEYDQKCVILAEMVHESRRREVPYYGDWFRERGYLTFALKDAITELRLDEFLPGQPPSFEGQGDAIWHPGKELLWCGHGFRTDVRACKLLSFLAGAPVIPLKLVDPKFYHLDTCFAPLDGDAVLIYPGAFDNDSLGMIRHFFRKVIEVSKEEAENFACNCVVIKRKVILQKDNPKTCKSLRKHNLEPVELDTSEFMKSGGSVFCLKMMYY